MNEFFSNTIRFVAIVTHSLTPAHMSDLNVPLADDASQASRSSLSGSLLDRIRAQREKEAAPVAQPERLVVPNYNNPVETSDPSNAAWSMDFSIPRYGGGNSNNEATMSLLGDEEGSEPYSMTKYFQTFVQDTYNAFRSLHPVAQGVVAVTLFALALWLLDVL